MPNNEFLTPAEIDGPANARFPWYFIESLLLKNGIVRPHHHLGSVEWRNSMLLPVILAAMVGCPSSNLDSYIGDWQSTSNTDEHVKITRQDGGISVDMFNEFKDKAPHEENLPTLVTIDGRLVVVIKYPYATVLDIDKKTGYLKGGESTYVKSSAHQ